MRYVFSAGSKGRPRLVSAAMTLEQVRQSLSALGLTGWQMEELLRGNRMARVPRTTGYLAFDEQRLLELGLRPVVEEVEPAAV